MQATVLPLCPVNAVREGRVAEDGYSASLSEDLGKYLKGWRGNTNTKNVFALIHSMH